MRKLEYSLVLGLSLLVLHLGHSSASAQELLVPPANGATNPSGLGLPGFELNPQGSGTRDALPELELPELPGTSSGSTMDSTTTLEPIPAGELQQGLEQNVEGEQYRIFDYHPAALESTGTWLRRGFWYSEVDAVLMDRVWRRDNFVLGFQDNELVSTIFGTNPAGNELVVDAGRSGAEAAPRLTLGRFLFRDAKNRDHTAEFVAYGGGQWSQGGRLDAVPGGISNGTLTVGSYTVLQVATNIGSARLPLDNGNPSFDGATAMEYSYDSRMNNFELNYHLKQRMGRDRMEMEPSGRWVRRAKKSSSFSILAGLRYFDLNEDFDWNAFGIDDDNDVTTAPQTGTYLVRTDNDLIGAQLGGSWTIERARWSLGLKTKSGMFLNHTNVINRFEVTGGVTEGDNEMTIDNLSFIVEGGLQSKVHVAPNLSIRSGIDIMYVGSVALAAEQLNFVPVSTYIDDTGSATYMGGHIGFEAYW